MGTPKEAPMYRSKEKGWFGGGEESIGKHAILDTYEYFQFLYVQSTRFLTIA